jgi:hypothetical protein
MDEFSDPTPIATAAEYRVALLAVRDGFPGAFNDSDGLKLIKAHYRAPRHTSTTAELNQRVQFSSYSEVNLRYGIFASCVARALCHVPAVASPGNPHWWRTLAYGNDGVPLTEDGRYEWIMRPELCEALETMHWVERDQSVDPMTSAKRQ